MGSLLLFIVVSCQTDEIAKISEIDKDIPLVEDKNGEIRAAAPDRPTAKPAKPRKLLVFYRCEGFAHSAIPYCNRTLKILGEKTGAFTTEFSDDMKAFTIENLRRFDAVVLNNTTRLKFDDPSHRIGLIDFVEKGGGLVGIHAATDNFYDWPEACQMIGGVFDGHPWGANGTWAFKLDEPAHPLNRAFEGKGFLMKDEIYQISGPYSRDNLRVLVSLDMTNSRNLEVQGIKRNDSDFAVSWIRKYGKGRVFYCSLGHNHDLFWNKAVLRHYLDGVQYALGDLEMDHRPSAELDIIPAPALTTGPGDVDDPYSAISEYDYGKNRYLLSVMEEKIRNASAEEMARIESKLLTMLQSKFTSFAGKQFICRMLRRAGSEDSLSALSEMLLDYSYSDIALFALEGMPYPEVDDILINALKTCDAQVKVSIIGSLSNRRSEVAVNALADYLNSKNFDLAYAAILALGRIGGDESVKALFDAKIDMSIKPFLADSLLLCGDSFLKQGNIDKASAIYRGLISGECSSITRIAAWRGIALSEKQDALPELMDLLKDSDDDLMEASAKIISELPEGVKIDVEEDLVSTLSPKARILLIYAVASRNATETLPFVIKEAQSDDLEVRIAAIKALGILGGPSEVNLLADAVTMDEGVLEAASESLNRLKGPGVDDAILSCLENSAQETRSALIRCAAVRNIKGAVSYSMECALDENPDVKVESFNALKTLCGPDDLPDLLNLLKKVNTDEDHLQVKETFLAVLAPIEDENEKTGFILDAIKIEESRTRAALFSVLGGLACESSLNALMTALDGEDEIVTKASAQALAEWPDSAPMKKLLELAGATSNEEIRSASIEGVINMMLLPHDRSSDESKELYTNIIECAKTADEKKAVIAGLADLAQTWAFSFLESYQNDIEFSDDVNRAKIKIMSILSRKVSHDAAGCTVTLANPCSEKYTGGNDNALTDGKWGSTTYGDGCWQGFKGVDLAAVVDLGKEIRVNSIRAGFLRDCNSWIFPPKKVVFSISLDGEDFRVVKTFVEPVPESNGEIKTQDFFTETDNLIARYVKVYAENVGTCPKWHPGAGGEAWLFSDEIQINPQMKE